MTRCHAGGERPIQVGQGGGHGAAGARCGRTEEDGPRLFTVGEFLDGVVKPIYEDTYVRVRKVRASRLPPPASAALLSSSPGCDPHAPRMRRTLCCTLPLSLSTSARLRAQDYAAVAAVLAEALDLFDDDAACLKREGKVSGAKLPSWPIVGYRLQNDVAQRVKVLLWELSPAAVLEAVQAAAPEADLPVMRTTTVHG